MSQKKNSNILKKSRYMFTAITLFLFSFLFICFFFAYSIYLDRSNYQDTINELNWLADNEPFSISEKNPTDKFFFDIDYYGYTPIICLLIDSKGDIIDTRYFGNKSQLDFSEKVINDLLTADPNCHKMKHYAYCSRSLEDGSRVILAEDYKSFNIIKYHFIILSLIIFSLIIIALISYFLSGLFIKPLEQTIERERQLSADVSHTLKTPLAAIKANLYALAIDVHDNKHLSNALDGVDRMNNLITDMLEIEQLEFSKNHSSYSEQDISKILTRQLLHLEVIAFDEGLTLEYDVPDRIIMKSEPNDIERLITIMVENSIKYSEPGAIINVSLRQSAKHVILDISDTGIGISKEDLPHIFERFYCCEYHAANSSGLGLAMARTIAEKYKGYIEVSSDLGKGSRFVIKMSKK